MSQLADHKIRDGSGSVWRTVAVALLIAAGIATYSNSFGGPFIFDDKAFIEQATARNVWLSLTSLRPIVQFTFALNHSLGSGVWGYHAVNLAVHVLAALTLFGVVRRTLMLLPPQSQCGAQTGESGGTRSAFPCSEAQAHTTGFRTPRSALALALVIALLWMLHPLQTESVTYIVQRTESLMGLFYLLTLYCFIRAAGSTAPDGLGRQKIPSFPPRMRGGNDIPDPGFQCAGGTETTTGFSVFRDFAFLRSKLWFVAAVAACVLGMGSKEVMVTAPLLVLLYDRTFIAGSFREALRRRRGFYLALAASWLIVAGRMTEAFASSRASAGFGVQTCTPFQYARTEPGVILRYLQLAFWPAGLCLDYGWPAADSMRDILPGVIVLGALLTMTVWLLVRRPSWGFLAACFFLILAPTSSVMPIKDLACEHRMYLSLAAVITAVVLALHTVARTPLRRGIALALLALTAAVLGGLAFQRNDDYRSAVSIWQDVIKKRPENPRGWANLGAAFLEKAQREPPADSAKLCRTAEDLADEALHRKPDFALAFYNRAMARACLGRYVEALDDCNMAIQLDPEMAPAYVNRGNIHMDMRHPAEAADDYKKAVSLVPDSDTWYDLGNAHAALRRPGLAIGDYTHAIELDPTQADVYYNRALAYSEMKEYAKARADIKRYEKLGGPPDPKFLQSLPDDNAIK